MQRSSASPIHGVPSPPATPTTVSKSTTAPPLTIFILNLHVCRPSVSVLTSVTIDPHTSNYRIAHAPLFDASPPCALLTADHHK
ncbi:hypothetical protein U1Q18_019412 [Sarracenia purpurea var. burkii]